MNATHENAQTCSRLAERLKEAEGRLEAALRDSPAEHPLVHPARELMEIHREMRDAMLSVLETGSREASHPVEHDPEVVSAAIQIEREAHTLKPEFKDILKSLLMWKDDPVERVKGTSF